MKVLITGAGGQLGTDLGAHCRRVGDDVADYDRSRLDITDPDQVHRAVKQTEPDVVINCAAWTAVDACEADLFERLPEFEATLTRVIGAYQR